MSAFTPPVGINKKQILEERSLYLNAIHRVLYMIYDIYYYYTKIVYEYMITYI